MGAEVTRQCMKHTKDELIRMLEQLLLSCDSILHLIHRMEHKRHLSIADLAQLVRPYHQWYEGAHEAVAQLVPQRLEEFVSCYSPRKSRKTTFGPDFVILDFLRGFHSDVEGHWHGTARDVIALVGKQRRILESCKTPPTDEPRT